MSPEKRAFYEYHASLTEPWDGPAAVAFTDGRLIGATLDRNGLRPARYLETKDGHLVMASEAGVLPFKPEEIARKGRLQPGKMLLVDLDQGRIVPDEEIKVGLASRQPYAEWLKTNQVTLESLPEPTRVQGSDHETVLIRQRCFGYTDEDVRMLITPMASEGEEAIGSMGIDTPLACLSDKPQAAFQLLQAAVCAGNQPAYRSDQGRTGDVSDQLHRHRAEHAGGNARALSHLEDAAADPDQSGTRETAAGVPRRPACFNSVDHVSRCTKVKWD